MKLYLIIDYSKDYGSNFDEESENFCTSSNVNVRSSNVHEHETVTNLKDFIAYRAFEMNFCRSRYSKFEYQLIDVPDVLMFQLMLTGVQDYDYIAYNHITKRIYVSNSSHDVSMYASCPDDRLSNSSRRTFNGSVGYQNNASNSNAFFEFQFDNNSEHNEKKREDYCTEIDINYGYEEVKEVLMPYIMEKYYKDFTHCSNFLIRTSIVIGRQSATFAKYYNDSPKMMEKEIAEVLQIPREDMIFMFTSFIEDDVLYVKNKHRFKSSSIEAMRSFSADILTNFTEKTEYN